MTAVPFSFLAIGLPASINYSTPVCRITAKLLADLEKVTDEFRAGGVLRCTWGPAEMGVCFSYVKRLVMETALAL